MKSASAKPPKLYSLIKLHKNGYPIRPVVSFFTAPSYIFSKKLIYIITENTNFLAKYSVKNSTELINKIKNINLADNAKLISFDVTNLFPSVPIIDTLVLLEKLLDSQNLNYIKKQEILESVKTCLNQNCFEFNNNFYSSNEGLIMGNPLSPLLAKIFMDHLENIICKHPLFKQFIYWHRYVDDILTCFTGTDRQLTQFLEFINTIHNNIKFTIEKEVDKSINFLDLTITRENNTHNFSIFHKPSYTDTVIHSTSCHPIQHKFASFHSMLHRLLTVPLQTINFNKELNIIKQIAVNNGYNPNIIDKLLKQKLYKTATQMIFPTSIDRTNNYKTLTYVGQTSYKIGNFLKKLNVKIAFKTNNTLSKNIKNNKSKTNITDQSGVYQLTCANCPKTYIGQTGRIFSKRIKEHYSSFINKKSDSHYANHLLEENHDFNNQIKILHIENKGNRLNLLESLEINKLKHNNNLLNSQIDLNNSPLLNLF